MINKTLKNKKEDNNIFLNLLFKSKNLYGDSLKNLNKDILPYLYGVRHNYTIINLKNLSVTLKRVFKLIKSILIKKQKILIIGNADEIYFLLNKQFTKNNKNIIFFNKTWVNGFLTNKQINSFLLNKKIGLALIVKSSIDATYLHKELTSLQIPIVSFVNTNQSLKGINYPVVTNTHNIQSIFNLLFLLRKNF